MVGAKKAFVPILVRAIATKDIAFTPENTLTLSLFLSDLDSSSRMMVKTENISMNFMQCFFFLISRSTIEQPRNSSKRMESMTRNTIVSTS